VSPNPAIVRNRIELDGKLLELGALRYSPAGIPVIEFKLGHESTQDEAGLIRRVECEMTCVAIGPLSLLMTDVHPGNALRAAGFMTAKSLKNRQPVFHVNTIEFL
jgi:primosomal replication protein N